MQRQFKVKVVFLGSVSVGKTSIANYLVNKEPPTSTSPTVGGSYFNFDLPSHPSSQNKFSIMLWDTAGGERYSSMLPVYLRSAQVALIVCDVKDDDSIIEVKNSIDQLKNVNPQPASASKHQQELECKPIFILNKCDLATDELIAKQEQILRKTIKASLDISSSDIIIIKTCGLNGIGVYDAPGGSGHSTDGSFSAIVPALNHILSALADDNELIVQRVKGLGGSSNTIDINDPTAAERKGGCC